MIPTLRRSDSFSARPLRRRDCWIGAVVIFALACLFLTKPILNLGTQLFSPADLGSAFPLTKFVPAEKIKNGMLGDVYASIHPGQLYNRELLQRGQLPLWNPYNAAGVPHLANYQSAVFSIFNIPVYFLPLPIGLVVSAFLRLFLAGFLTFLFLRGTGLRNIPSLLGGIAYMFSGNMIVWLGYTVSSTAALIPGLLFFADQAISHFGWDRRTIFALSGLFVCQTLDLFAGHPETAYIGALLTGGYAAFRLVLLARRRGPRLAVKVGSLLLLAELLALGVTAIQLLPFFEYISQGSPEIRGVQGQILMPASWLPLFGYPDILGSPADRATINIIGMAGNFSEKNSFHIGLACLFIVFLGIAFLRHKKNVGRYVFFLSLIGLWLIYALGLFGLRPLFNVALGLTSAYFGRSASIFLLAATFCAAFSLDALIQRRRSLRLALIFVGVGCAVLVVVAISAINLLVQSTPLIMSFGLFYVRLVHSHVAVVSDYFNQTTLLFGATIVLTAWMCITRAVHVRRIMALLIVGVVFFQGGWLLKDYNPTISAQDFYPDNATIASLRAAVTNGGRVLLMQGRLMLPDSNLFFRIPTTSNYDSINPTNYFVLKTTLFGSRRPFQDADHLNETGLKLFGVQVIVTEDVKQSDIYLTNPAYAVYDLKPTYLMMRYQNVLPAFHVVYDTQLADTNQTALALIGSPDFDPAKTVILSASPDLPPVTLSAGTQTDQPKTANLIVDEPTRTVIDLPNHSQAGYLVTARLFYPGWKAKVDGQPVPVYRGNYAFAAIPIGANAHQVEYYYDSDVIKLGAFVTVFCLPLAGGLVLIALRRW